jgi:hypothetical protein
MTVTIMRTLRNYLLTARNKKSKASSKLRRYAASSAKYLTLTRNTEPVAPRMVAEDLLAGGFSEKGANVIFAYNIQRSGRHCWFLRKREDSSSLFEH